MTRTASTLVEIAELAADMAENERKGAINVLQSVMFDVWDTVSPEIEARGGRIDDLRDCNLSVPLMGNQFDKWARSVLDQLPALPEPAVNSFLATMLMMAYAQWGVGATREAAQSWLHDQPGMHHAL